MGRIPCRLVYGVSLAGLVLAGLLFIRVSDMLIRPCLDCTGGAPPHFRSDGDGHGPWVLTKNGLSATREVRSVN